MGVKNVSGYVKVVFSGVILLAAALLIILQWDGVTEFSLFGKRFSILVIDGRLQGGVNTAVLMLCSAAAGVVLLWLVKVFFRGASALRRARKAAAAAAPPKPAPAPPASDQTE